MNIYHELQKNTLGLQQKRIGSIVIVVSAVLLSYGGDKSQTKSALVDLDKEISGYEVVFQKKLPSWFWAHTDEEKILYLRYIFYGRTRRPYLSEEEEDSIKTKLKKVIATSESSGHRKMTELEKTMAEYEIQFDKPLPPNCRWSDGELLSYMKEEIGSMAGRMKTATDKMAASNKVIIQQEKRFGRKLTVLEKCAIEYETITLKPAPVYQCHDKELLAILKRAMKMNRPIYYSIDINHALIAEYEAQFNRPAPYKSYYVSPEEFRAILKKALRTNTPYVYNYTRDDKIARLDIVKAMYEEYFNLPTHNGQYSDIELYAIMKNALETNNPNRGRENITALEMVAAEYEIRFNCRVDKCLSLPEHERLKELNDALKNGMPTCTYQIVN